MKILLVYPNSTPLPSYFKYIIEDDIKDTIPPLGMLYLISNSQHEIDFLDNRLKKLSDTELFNYAVRYDVIGFGGTIFESKQARTVSKRLMQAGKTTIYGGPNATVNWNLYLGEFTIIARGEIEGWFDSLVTKKFYNQFDLVGGSYVNREIFREFYLEWIKWPRRAIINLNDYRRKEKYVDESPIDTVVSSRGCPYNCYFCSSKIVWGRKYSFRDTSDVLSECKHLEKVYGSKAIYFREDNFTVNQKRLLELCENMPLPWMCESRADLSEEQVKTMAQGKCKAIWFGIEVTENEDFNRINKNLNIETVRKTIELCNKYNIRTGGSFMLGYPFDDKAKIVKRIKDAKKLGLWNVYFNRVFSFPKSEMHTEIIDNNLDGYSIDGIVIPSTYFLSMKEVNKLHFKYCKRNYLIKMKVKRLFK